MHQYLCRYMYRSVIIVSSVSFLAAWQNRPSGTDETSLVTMFYVGRDKAPQWLMWKVRVRQMVFFLRPRLEPPPSPPPLYTWAISPDSPATKGIPNRDDETKHSFLISPRCVTYPYVASARSQQRHTKPPGQQPPHRITSLRSTISLHTGASHTKCLHQTSKAIQESLPISTASRVVMDDQSERHHDGTVPKARNFYAETRVLSYVEMPVSTLSRLDPNDSRTNVLEGTLAFRQE